MKLRNLTFAGCAFLLSLLALPLQSYAQWRLGASYEIRQKEPKDGFGVRLEKEILGKLPIVHVRLRAHFSYFSDQNGVSKQGVSYGKIQDYDYGLAATGGVSVGLIEPYVGLGLGSTTFNIDYNDAQNAGSSSDSKVFWQGFVGAELSPIPVLKPFVEYQFQQFDNPKFAPDSKGRLLFGLTLAF